MNCFDIKNRELRPITLKVEKTGEQQRTEGHYGERAGDWEEEGSEGGGRELREEAQERGTGGEKKSAGPGQF